MKDASIYCDYNAGAPTRPEAVAAMTHALTLGGNPSSVHAFGRRARALVEDARETLATGVGARAENVVFTSGATEALHLAMACAGAASCVVTAVEHDAVYEHAVRARPEAGVAPVGPDGLVDCGELAKLLACAEKPTLVAVQLANNETGVVQPIAKVAALCREHGALLLVDAAQALGRLPLNIGDLDATYLVVSSHKLGGPPGAGALILAPGAPFRSNRFGGGQERGRRPGTENVPAIAGFGAALKAALRDIDTEAPRVRALRDRFESALPDSSVVFGRQSPRLPNTSNFGLPGVSAETAVIALDLEGVALSSGAACSSGKVRSSRVLAAMGVEPGLARAGLRASFGYLSTDADVDALLRALAKIVPNRGLGAAP